MQALPALGEGRPELQVMAKIPEMGDVGEAVAEQWCGQGDLFRREQALRQLDAAQTQPANSMADQAVFAVAPMATGWHPWRPGERAGSGHGHADDDAGELR